jgi:hypothetical protein
MKDKSFSKFYINELDTLMFKNILDYMLSHVVFTWGHSCMRTTLQTS